MTAITSFPTSSGTAPAVARRTLALPSRTALVPVVLLAALASFAAPDTHALIVRDDITVPPRFLPPIELAAGSRLFTTVEDGVVVLHGHVEGPLEHFLARRAISARHRDGTRFVDRVIVLPARPSSDDAYPAGTGGTRVTVPGPAASARAVPTTY